MDLVECDFSWQQGENRGVIEHLAQVTNQLLLVEAVTFDRAAGHRLDDFCLNAHGTFRIDYSFAHYLTV